MSKLQSPLTELRSINYGHFGLPSYDHVQKQWTFSKLTAASAPLEQLGQPQVVVPATAIAGREVFLRDDTNKTEEHYYEALEAELRQLVINFPELQPAEALIKPMVRLSEGVAHAMDAYDPAIGELLSTGSFMQTGGDRPQELLALPGGECGEVLRLILLCSQRYKIDDCIFELRQPTDEIGWWTGKGAPILQVCFSESNGKESSAALLAVRLQGCVIVMFPRYREHPVPAPGIALDSPPPPSRLDPNILFELTPRQAQNVTFADLVFNPWNHREFVVVDQAGQWTTFKIVRQSQGAPIYAPVMMQKGRLPVIVDQDTEEEEAQPSVVDDHVVESVEDTKRKGVDSIAHQSPRDIEIPMLKIESRPPASGSPSPALRNTPSASTATKAEVHIAMNDGHSQTQIEGNKEEEIKLWYDGWIRVAWILNRQTLVVCTRKHAYLVDVLSGDCLEIPSLISKDPYLAGWYLDMKSCSHLPDHIFFLTSRSVNLVRIYDGMAAEVGHNRRQVAKARFIISALHFRDRADLSLRIGINQEMDDHYLVTVTSQFNPVASYFRFKVPIKANDHVKVADAMQLTFPEDSGGRILALHLMRVSIAEELENFSTSRSRFNGRLYNAQVLNRDFGMRQIFFQATPSTRAGPSRMPQRITNVSKNSDIWDEFVVPDASIGMLRMYGSDISGEDVDEYTFLGGQKIHVDLQEAVNSIENTAWDPRCDLIPSASVDDISARLHSIVSKQKLVAGPRRTLFEWCDHAIPRMGDLREASFILEDVFAASSGAAAVTLYPRSLPLPWSNETVDQILFDDLHAYLEENYVLPLDERIPSAFQQQREDIIKSIAAEILLASARIENPIKEEGNNENHVADTDATSLTQLMISSQTEIPEGSQALSTPSATGPRAFEERSPYRTSLSTAMDKILQRLELNVDVNIKPTQSWSLKPMTILSHWDLGMDPEDYSYVETMKMLDEERNFIGLSGKEKRLFNRRQQRAILRRQREARRTEQLTQGSSQAPSILSSQIPVFDSSQSKAVTLNQLPTVSRSQAQGVGPSSQLPSIGVHKHAKNSQVSGFGSQSIVKSKNQKLVAGFGSQPVRTPKSSRTKNVPDSGNQSISTLSRSNLVHGAATSSQKGERPIERATDAIKNDLDGVQNRPDAERGQSSSMELPMRPTVTTTDRVITSSARNSGTDTQHESSQRSALSSQRSGSQSQRLASSQANQTSKRRKQRKEGF